MDCQKNETKKRAFSIITKTLKSELTSANVYPYTGKKGKKCIRNLHPRYKIDRLVDLIHVKRWWEEISRNETEEDFMARYIAQRGPIIGNIRMGYPQMHYKHGIIHQTNGNCGDNDKKFYKTNHAVAIVGFGRIKNLELPYWIVKNSWGPNVNKERSPNKGYYFIYRGANICNIAVRPKALKLLPIELHEQYEASGCPKKTKLPKGKQNKRD